MVFKKKKGVNILTVKRIAKITKPIFKKHGVKRAGIFGSYARGDANKRSDIDILVQLQGRKSYFDLIELEEQLQEKLGRKVDLLTYKSIHPLLKQQILKEEVRIV